jgi:hypothetical protein
MSTFAKGLTIGVLVSASLAVPIVAMVTYLQTKPANTTLLQFMDPDRLPRPLAATIAEPELMPVEALVTETPSLTREVMETPSLTREVMETSSPARQPNLPPHSPAPPSDPQSFVLVLPSVQRPLLLESHYTTSPSVRSIGMPAPIQKVGIKSLHYEEQFR